MTRAARVLSIDDVDAVSAALTRFAEETAGALADLDLEIRRALEWVQQDRKLHWDQEVRRGWDAVAGARRELERRMITHKVADHRPSCVEEKKALALAKRRLDVALEKVKAVRRWSHAVEKESNEYRGSIGPLAQWLSADFPRAIASLRRMAGALDHYVAVAPSAAKIDAEGPSSGLPSAARGTPEPPADRPAQDEAPATAAPQSAGAQDPAREDPP